MATGRRSAPFPMVDGMCLLPADLADLGRAGLSGVMTDVSVVLHPDGSLEAARTYELLLKNLAATRARLRSGNEAVLATGAPSILEAHRHGRTAVLFQVQGADPLDADLGRLPVLHELGLRVLQLTHNRGNAVAGSATDPRPQGLSGLGRELIPRLQDLGILVDLAHASDASCAEAVSLARRPVVISHTGPRALVGSARCAPDDVLRAVGETGGVIGLLMMSMFVTPEPVATTDAFVRALRHIVDVAGMDAAAIGNDYEPGGSPHGPEEYAGWFADLGRQGVPGFDRHPQHAVFPELNDLDRMFTLADRLGRAGFHEAEVEKILGGNWIRVLGEAL